MATNLTDAKLRSLPFETGQRDYPDRDGLFVRVGRSRKTFMVTLRENGQRRRVTIGHYPDIGLSAARAKARQLRTEAENKPETPQLTFESALESYYRIHGPKQRPVTRKECQRILNKHFRPHLATKLLDSIKTAQLAIILDAIERDPSRRCAYVVLRAFFNWCYRRGYIEHSPVTRLEAPPVTDSRDHLPAPDEVCRIWHACPPDEYGQIVKLCIVSGQRIGQWMRYRPEYRHDDCVIWPREAMKADRNHVLPVTPLLESLLPDEPFTWRMDSHHKERLQKASRTNGWTHHDFRRLFATVAADELGIAPHVIEAVLAHATGSQVARVYNRAKHLQPMREALLAYENWLLQVVNHREPTAPLATAALAATS